MGKINGVDRRTWNPYAAAPRLRGLPQLLRGTSRFALRGRGKFAISLVRHAHPIRPRWTGKVELIESKLTEPLHWRKPQRVFVNSMSDLLHEALPDEAIDRVFAVMALCPQHTFQVLTKRPDRMLRYLSENHGHEARRRVQDVIDQ